MQTLVVFASGTGSNCAAIIKFFKSQTPRKAEVALVVSNNPNAGVLTIAAANNIETCLISKDGAAHPELLLKLQEIKPALIVLAGYLRKLPAAIIDLFPERILNIHPALLPDFGGKGMYGRHVHEAVIAAGRTQSGITIHYVDQHYDQGDVLLQARISVLPGETPDSLAQRIHRLEHFYLPRTIEFLLSN